MKRLTEKHFAFICPMNWEEMEISGNGRHCEKCRKQVFDLSHCTIDEVIALQRKHGNICGSTRVAKTAALALSLSAAACETNPPEHLMGKIRAVDGPYQVVAGGICPPEQLEKTKNK